MALGYQALVGDLTSYIAANARRKVFYANPQGAATLTGLLSLAETEETDGPEFSWHEDRLTEKTALTTDVTDGSAGPWANSSGTGAATFSITAGDTMKLKVTSNEVNGNWAVGEQFVVHANMNAAGTARVQVNGYITAITTVSAKVAVWTVVIVNTVTVRNTANTDEGMLVQSLGVPFAEGSRSPAGNAMIYPIMPGNYTQIFRKSAAFTRTMLNQPLFFDSAGGYRSQMRRTGLNHLIDIENAALFGQRTKTTVTDSDGTSTVVRTMGGIHWFLTEYEKADGGSFGYRPGGAALTALGDDDKRIFQGASSALTRAEWRVIEEKLFRRSMVGNNEKLVLGGNTFIRAVMDYYRANAGGTISINRDFEEGHKLSMGLTQIQMDYGTLYLKSHPRFNDRSHLRKCGFVLDMGNLRLRPMAGCDTHRNTNIQANDFDGRKDEFMTECALEVNFPESHAYFEDVATIATS